MSLAADLHAAHKARLERLNRRPIEPKPEPEPVQVLVTPEMLGKLQDQINNLADTLIEQGNTIATLAKQMAEVNPYYTEILDAVCEFYGVTRTDIVSARRTWDLTRPRMIAFYLGRKLTGLSLPQIGARTGNRDHTTVLHGANKISSQMQEDDILRDDLDVLEARIAEKVVARQPPLRGQS